MTEGHVAGWDDPRMPTIRGLRRRGYTPEAMRAFCERIGVTKQNSTIDMLWLEDAVREHLNETAPRRMAVLRPLKVTLTAYADGSELPEELIKVCELDNHPQDPSQGTREVPLTRELWIERDDFMEEAPKKFFRLKPGGAVRLRGAGIAIFQEMVKDDAGEVVEVRCTFDPDTTAKHNDKKVKGTIHWVGADDGLDAEVRLYDHLFAAENPDKAEEGKTFLDNLNPESLEIVVARLEPSPRRRRAGRAFPIRAAGLLPRGPDRHGRRGPGLQPHGDAAGRLGEGSEEVRVHSSHGDSRGVSPIAACRASRSSRFARSVSRIASWTRNTDATSVPAK